MARGLFLVFGIVSYCIFFATFLYLVAFVGNLPGVPTTVDRGVITRLAPALLTDLLLIALFGLQHSVMARQGFKRTWTRIVPPPIERSVYVLFASVALMVMFLFWRPIGAGVWRVENDVAVAVLWGLFALGWLIVLLSTFLINHFELFGLKQVYLHLRSGTSTTPRLRQPFLYKLVRHPLYSGFILAFWATPVMTAGHLVLALGMTVYILIAIRYEERDLIGVFGQDYATYRQNVGMLTPRFRRHG
ncbi:isoprenylcysteine carboxylmethyltransferase family protein [soil metagenome]